VHALEGAAAGPLPHFLQVYFPRPRRRFEYYLERAVAEGEVALPLARGLRT